MSDDTTPEEIARLIDALRTEKARVEVYSGCFAEMTRLNNDLLKRVQELSEKKPVVNPWKVVAEELREALAGYVPDKNCSCHIAPPCSDCVEHGYARETMKQYEEQRLLDKETEVKP